VGLAILEALSAGDWGEEVEFVDGGTQGLTLLGRIEGRQALVVLDAVARGAAPGTIHTMTGEEALRLGTQPGATVHEGGASTLLAASALLGDLPAEVVVVGVEPRDLNTKIGLSPPVAAALPEAVRKARQAVLELLERIGENPETVTETPEVRTPAT
jgi:hydrogenase maturation protease